MTTDDRAKMQMKEHQRLSKQLWIASAFTDALSDDKSKSTVACDKHNLKILFTDENISSWLEDTDKIQGCLP